MADTRTQNIKSLNFRANLPRYVRFGALGLLALTVLAIGIGYYRARSVTEFRMKGFPTELSKEVLASVNGYERREVEGEAVKYYIKADKATTFADNHQELENVYLQVFDAAGQGSDEITANKAVYIPEESKNFTTYFAGAVNITTRDLLKVKTEQVTYKKASETATADEQVSFERMNIRGQSFGAVVKTAEKLIELSRDVRIETFGDSGEVTSTVSAGYASYDQQNEKVELQQSVRVETRSTSESSTAQASRANIFLSAPSEKMRDVSKLELFENVQIENNRGGSPTKITSGYALYEKAADRFDLRHSVSITAVEGEGPTIITADHVVYEQSKGLATLEGNAQITQNDDLIKGKIIVAELYANKSIKNSVIRGDAYLKQQEPENTTEIFSPELNAAFAEDQNLTNADAIGQSTVTMTPANAAEYSKVTMLAAKAIRVIFKTQGLMDRMNTEGRTTIKLDVPDNGNDSANKQVTADTVKTTFNADGKNLQKAEAVGNAELLVLPHRNAVEIYHVAVNAPRFDCEFFPSGNNAKNCHASTGTKTVRTPTVKREGRGNQIITADRLNASFSQQSKNIERLDASGKARFVELDRNGLANEFSFMAADEVVKLRGGEPTAWDSKARVKAKEIDWDTKNRKSLYRGAVSTTYYNQNNTGGATPFGDAGRPVYITADAGEIDHNTEVALYTGNARGWQASNYVRANRLLIRQRDGQMSADGSVQSLLYDIKRKEGSKESTLPVYAASQAMTYDRNTRILRYERDVDIRQGSDRILGAIAIIHLSEKNEVTRTDIENNVVITQPKRRATGDFAMYTTADERVLLRGNPARVDEAEKGSAQGAELIMYLKENRVTGEGKSKQNPAGRVRSVYKVTNE